MSGPETSPNTNTGGMELRLLGQLVPHLRAHWRYLLLTLCLIPVTIGFELAQPYVVKLAFQHHLVPREPEGLEWLLLAFSGCIVAQGISSYFETWALQSLGQRAMHDLRMRTYHHIMRQRVAYFDHIAVGRLTTRVTNDIETINEMFAQGVVTMLADLVRMLAILAIMFSIDFTLSIIILASLPFLWLVVRYARDAMRTSFRTIRQRVAAMNGHAYEHLSGIRVLHALGRLDRAAHEYRALNAGHRDAYIDSIRADAVMYALVEMIGVFAVAAVGLWLAGELGASRSTASAIGVAIVFIEYGNKFFLPLRDLSAKYTVMQSAMAALERLRQLMSHDEPDAPVQAPLPGSAATPPAPSTNGTVPHLAFRGVQFSYRKDEPILRGLSFEVAHGQTVALVGATGSGKSTIIKLLTRLYELDGGTIELEGVDIRQLAGADLRRRISVISQDAFFMDAPLRDNLALGAEVSDDALLASLRRLDADAILARRQLTLDARIAERGGNLSAGEKQLLAFARALLRDSDVLVLDEATAHVDPETEAALERGLAALGPARTTVIIAHRLDTIARADLILVVDRGEIVERGTFRELVAANGQFAAMEREFSRADNHPHTTP